MNNLGPIAQLGETQTSYVFSFELPGVKADEIEIIIQEQTLVVRGSYNPTVKDKAVEIVASERRAGPFQRVVAIPAAVDEENVTATLEDGVLEIELLKKNVSSKSIKKIEIGKRATKSSTSSSTKSN